ncbi:nucleoporin 62 like [Chanos chanos]|uniref:Nuclear pore glycoprotein p62 n=1 Tax=Chanos chanos TaxID=29144 RepID=A0A6J2X0V0_CHACN|nr:nuclear pore glycoprotein p62-like [Chanos chanos]
MSFGGFAFGTQKTTAGAPAVSGFGLQVSTAGAGAGAGGGGGGGGFPFGTTSQPPAQPPAQPPGSSSSFLGLLNQQPATSNGVTQGGFSFGTPAQSSSAASGFAFGGTSSTPKLGLGLPTSSQPAAAAPPTLGTQATAAPGSGFTFGALSTQAPAPAPAAAQPSGGVFSFGTPKVQATAAAPAQPTATLSLGAQSTGLGSTAAVSTASATTQGFSFGIKTAAPPAPATSAPASQASSVPGSSLFAMPVTSTPASGFTLGGSTISATPATTSASAPTALPIKPQGTITTSAATTAAATTAATTAFSLGSLKAPAPTALTTTIAPISTATTTTSAAPVMSYAQLEALINKWSSELEDQERHFLQQATQVNAWDRMLVENGDKITALHKDMEKVKLDQRRLDQELDFILSQQKELEDLLGPLEESVKEQSGSIYMQNADEERERTYKLAENVDAQLKRMSQDLKEIIEHLNTSSGPPDTTDPLQQICKILNAHMDSLQWVEQNSVLLQRRVEEVSKLCESRSKEQEKSFRLHFQ